MKFELNRLGNYSDEEIVREIRRVAEVLHVNPLTISAFEKESKVKIRAIHARFGGWKEALEAAELGHLYSGQVVTKNMRDQKNRGITDDELLNELRRVANILGRKDISTRDFNKHGHVKAATYSYRFGSWKKAIELAGLEVRSSGATTSYSTQDLFQNLLNIWMHYGRQPHYSEMNTPPSAIKARNYHNRFGTWRKALLAFIEYTENADSSQENEVLDLPPLKKSSDTPKLPEDRREISLGLRFKVMYRDHFKCVLCGNNPPATPGLILHVDHILPWSRGGKTEIGNLRTLCASCNIGRGNKYSE